MVKVRSIKHLEMWEPTKKGCWGSSNGGDPKIFRKRKPRTCYCGWHSQGKETFNPDQTKHWRKNKRLYWRRLLKRYKYA